MEHKISVPDMHCEKCVARINSALTETGISFKVNLSEKIITVDGCEHCLNTALSELEYLGFTPEIL